MGRPPIPPGGTGEAKSRQVRDRLWQVRICWRDDAGDYHTTTAEASSKRECEALAATRIAEARAALRQPTTEDLTLHGIAARCFDEMQRSRRRPSTIAQYRATWRGTLSPVLGRAPINQITRARVQQVLLSGIFARGHGHRADDGTWVPGDYRLDDHGQRIPLHGAQPRNVMRVVPRFAADCNYRTDGINPLDGTETPERSTPAVRALTDEESARLIDMAEHWHRTGHGASDVLWHGLILLRYTGLRVGELLALCWADVDLHGDPSTITARHPPQTGAEPSAASARPRAAPSTHARAAGGFVFATRTGKPVTQANFRRALRDLVRETDLAWAHPHSFHKTLATKAEAQLDLDSTARRQRRRP